MVYLLLNFKTTECENHFDTNSIKSHSAIIEVLPMSCFVLFGVTADGGHLGIPNCKKNQNGFMQGSLWEKVAMLPLRYSQFQIFLFLIQEAILAGLFYVVLKQLNTKIVFTQI